jgi:16S rRNA (adenine1518-N6/adenine1519-N6)-dimethyltransferase
MSILEGAPNVRRFVVMVQREVGERLAAAPGEEAYGAVSVKVAALAERSLVRRVPPEVFWPAPSVESVVVELARRREPAVDVDLGALFRVIDACFAERRKRITNGLRRLGLGPVAADETVRAAGLDPNVRAEAVPLEGFGRLTAALVSAGLLEPSG